MIEVLKQAKQVIAMMGAPNPLNFSREEIIAWQECNAGIDQAIAEAEKQEPVGWVDGGGLVFWKDKPPADGSDLYTSPKVESVARCMEHGECFGGKCIYTSPKVEQEPVAMQMDVIVVNLVREGINKHRARELAEHFIKHTSPKVKQEPMAVKHMMEWVDYLKRKSDYGQHMQIPSEMSAGACWDLALELEQFIKQSPPQRQPLEGVIDIKPIGYHSLQLIFKSQDDIVKFKSTFNIKE